jgi:hypothetical protein
VAQITTALISLSMEAFIKERKPPRLDPSNPIRFLDPE